MFEGKYIGLIFVFFCFTHSTHNLEVINQTESVEAFNSIKNTTAKLFQELQLKNKIKKLKQAAVVNNNFFTSATAKDRDFYENVKYITRVDQSDDNTSALTNILNDILNEDANGQKYDADDNEASITQYVDDFLSKLNGLKENALNDAYDKLDIKDELIHILTSDDPTKFNPRLQNNTDKVGFGGTGLTSDTDFWVPEAETRRIYRGKSVKIKYFPFMASIHLFRTFHCAGSIIASDLVLTAASCLQLAWNNRFFRENPAFLSVRVGSNFYYGGGEEIAVMEVYFYPTYNPKTLRNNIAVLRLVRHIKFRKKKRRVKKIDIDRSDHSLPVNTEGVVVVGWGARGVSNIVQEPWVNRLAFDVLDVYDLEDCQAVYSKEYVTKKNFCAGFISKGGGACNHDVGGPGVVNGVLVGIISFGSPVCGTPDAPTVFTKVGFYYDWIEEIMDQEVPHSRKRTTLLVPYTLPTRPPLHLLPTSFNIDPIPEPLEPIDIAEADTLRILEDESLFKEIVNTMFKSEEANDFTDTLFNDLPEENEKKTKIFNGQEKHGKNAQKQIERAKPKKEVRKEPEKIKTDVTRADNYISVPGQKKNFVGVTKMDWYENDNIGKRGFASKVQHNNQEEEEIDENILKIFNSDMSFSDELSKEFSIEEFDTIRTTKSVKRMQYQNETLKDYGFVRVSDKDTYIQKKLIDVLTEVDDSFDDSSDDSGMEIAVEGFKNKSLRNTATNGSKIQSVLDFLSKNELYDLLSEALDEVTNYKKPSQ